MKWIFKAQHASPRASTNPASERDALPTTEAAPRSGRRRFFGLFKAAGLGVVAAGGASMLQQNSQIAFAATKAGAFSSNASGTPAVKATGTNGAQGVQATSDTSYAISGTSTNSVGLYGVGVNFAGVYGTSSQNIGVYGTRTLSAGSGKSIGIVGSGNDVGIEGTSPSGTGVSGVSSGSGFGVSGTNAGGIGVHGSGIFGVIGTSSNGTGVSGFGPDGVLGASTSDIGAGVVGSGLHGVRGYTNGYGVYGYASAQYGFAGFFEGNVLVNGTLAKAGGSFLIDHPLDPANKSLSHSFVESPDMKNIYDGVTTLDVTGEAVIMLPDWFGALNFDFRYQLTCIGS